METPSERGRVSWSILKPHWLILARRGRSFARPSERSIMAVMAQFLVSQSASLRRGVKSRCFPRMEPPRVLVT